MDACNYNYNLMSLETLKFFVVSVEREIFDGRESLAISNPLFYKDKILETHTTLYISKDKKGGEYKYIISFFNVGEYTEILYYFCNKTPTIDFKFFRHIK
jgi:hypothetical protein